MRVIYVCVLSVLMSGAADAAKLVRETEEFTFSVDDSFEKVPNQMKDHSYNVDFDGWVSTETGFGIIGQCYRVGEWNDVIEHTTADMKQQLRFNLVGVPIQFEETTDSGEPVMVFYSKTDNPSFPVFLFYCFRTTPHAWNVYHVLGRSDDPQAYLEVARKIYKTVRLTTTGQIRKDLVQSARDYQFEDEQTSYGRRSSDDSIHGWPRFILLNLGTISAAFGIYCTLTRNMK